MFAAIEDKKVRTKEEEKKWLEDSQLTPHFGRSSKEVEPVQVGVVEGVLVVRGVVVVVTDVDLGVEMIVDDVGLELEDDKDNDEDEEELGVAVEGTLVAIMPSKAVACTSQFSAVPNTVSISNNTPLVKYRIKAARVPGGAQEVHHAPKPGRSGLLTIPGT